MLGEVITPDNAGWSRWSYQSPEGVPHGARLCFGGELGELLHRGGDDLALALEAVGVRFGDFDVDATAPLAKLLSV